MLCAGLGRREEQDRAHALEAVRDGEPVGPEAVAVEQHLGEERGVPPLRRRPDHLDEVGHRGAVVVEGDGPIRNEQRPDAARRVAHQAPEPSLGQDRGAGRGDLDRDEQRRSHEVVLELGQSWHLASVGRRPAENDFSLFRSRIGRLAEVQALAARPGREPYRKEPVEEPVRPEPPEAVLGNSGRNAQENERLEVPPCQVAELIDGFEGAAVTLREGERWQNGRTVKAMSRHSGGWMVAGWPGALSPGISPVMGGSGLVSPGRGRTPTRRVGAVRSSARLTVHRPSVGEAADPTGGSEVGASPIGSGRPDARCGVGGR